MNIMRSPLAPIVLTILAATPGTPVRAAVIDFESATPVVAANGPYVEDGFRLEAIGDGSSHYDIQCVPLQPSGCGNIHITFDNYSGLFSSAVRLSRVDGALFDLLGFDVERADTGGYATTPPYGYLTEPCAARCQVRSSAGGLADIVAGRMDFSAPGWRNLDWIDFLVPPDANPAVTTTVYVDNIEVASSPVPAPPALLLLATGLATLGSVQRRHVRSD